MNINKQLTATVLELAYNWVWLIALSLVPKFFGGKNAVIRWLITSWCGLTFFFLIFGLLCGGGWMAGL